MSQGHSDQLAQDPPNRDSAEPVGLDVTLWCRLVLGLLQLIEQLRSQVQTLTSRLADQLDLQQRNDELQSQVDWLNRQLFGRKSERTKHEDPRQLLLFDPPTEDEDTPTKPTRPKPEKKKRRGGGRRTPPPGAEIVERIYDVPEEQRRGMIEVEPEVTYQVAVRPAQVYWIKHIQRKYRPAPASQRQPEPEPENKPETEPQAEPETNEPAKPVAEPKAPASSTPGKPRGPFIRAVKPREGIYRCLGDPSLVAYIGISKFADHLPTHRQAKILRRTGADVSESTMNSWVLNGAWILLPLAMLARSQLLKSFVLMVDETTVRQLQLGKPWTHQSYFWVYFGDPDHPFVFVDYQPSRSAAGPLAFFGDAKDLSLPRPTYLQCDGYGVYELLTLGGSGGYAMIRVGCWAHARRYFEKALQRHPKPAKHAMALIARLYRIETQAAKMAPVDRGSFRREHAPAVIDELFAWCRGVWPGLAAKDSLAVAIHYLLNREADLRRYLEDGRLSIDNNACERAVRPLAIGRKNWMFVGNEAAGRAAAVWMSLIASCERCGVDPLAYHTDVLRRLPTTPAGQLRDLLPDRWQPSSG